MDKPVITITVTPNFDDDSISTDIKVKGSITLKAVLESILPLIEQLAEMHERHPNLKMGEYEKKAGIERKEGVV